MRVKAALTHAIPGAEQLAPHCPHSPHRNFSLPFLWA